MSKDLSTVLDTALSHASTHADDALSNALSTAMSHNSNSNASVPGFADLLPQTQGVPPSSPGSDPTPDSHSQADMHAGAGIIDHATMHAQGTLPDVVSLTGHDWFVHS
jgi:hypothetical protein